MTDDAKKAKDASDPTAGMDRRAMLEELVRGGMVTITLPHNEKSRKRLAAGKPPFKVTLAVINGALVFNAQRGETVEVPMEVAKIAQRAGLIPWTEELARPLVPTGETAKFVDPDAAAMGVTATASSAMEVDLGDLTRLKAKLLGEAGDGEGSGEGDPAGDKAPPKAPPAGGGQGGTTPPPGGGNSAPPPGGKDGDSGK